MDPTPPGVQLQGPYGAFPATDDRCVAMMLAQPWWSLEGSAPGHVELATLLKEAFL
jgi:hypothetical protein